MLKSAAYYAGRANTHALLGFRKIAGMTPLRAKVIRQGTERLHLRSLNGGVEGAAANARLNRSRFQAEAGGQGSFGAAGRVEGQAAVNPKHVHARRQQLDAIHAGAGDALTIFPKGTTLTPDAYAQARTRMDVYTKDVPRKGRAPAARAPIFPDAPPRAPIPAAAAPTTRTARPTTSPYEVNPVPKRPAATTPAAQPAAQPAAAAA
jgi:hypothetical protein